MASDKLKGIVISIIFEKYDMIFSVVGMLLRHLCRFLCDKKQCVVNNCVLVKSFISYTEIVFIFLFR